MRTAPVSPALRPAAAADAARIKACVVAAFEHYIPRIGKPPRPMLQDYAALIATRTVVVAEADGELAGILVCGPAPEGFKLDIVAVPPAYRGRGVGRSLIEWAEAEARRGRHAAIVLSTHRRMVENRRLYEKIGYVQYAEGMEDGYDRVYLRKPLERG